MTIAHPKHANLVLFRRLLREARPYWRHIAAMFFLNLFSTPLTLLAPVPLKIAVDCVIGARPLPPFIASLLPSALHSGPLLLSLVAGLVVTIAFLNHLQELGSLMLRTYTGERLVLAFRSKLFGHAQRLSLSYHDSKGTSDTAYRIQYDAPAIRWILIDGLSPILTAGFTLCGIFYVAAGIDWQLALVALAVSPVLWLISQAYGGRLRSQWHEVYNFQSSALSVIQEVLAAVRTVKAFSQEEREQERFFHRSSAGVGARIRLAFAEGGFGLLVGLTIASGTAAVLFLGTRHVQSGALTLGGLLMVMAYLTQLYGPLQTLSQMAANLQGSLASAERTFSLLDEAVDVVEKENARPLFRASGLVTFRHVSFAYDPARPVLQDISFEVMAGAHVGIMGVTGAGKTTLVNLLTRFYDPRAGEILLDGIDLRDYKLEDLRQQFAIVLQEPVLFSTTIAENIAYARPTASHEDIVAAARAANAHEFISTLPHGYETQVGEHGMTLSGGERQRISIARAFLKNAPILILDEPTSSVDIKTEAAIMNAMERLMQGRTAFMIAHRRSTLEICDRLWKIDNARIVDLASLDTPIIDISHMLGGHAARRS